jgi:hypothetical protein
MLRQDIVQYADHVYHAETLLPNAQTWVVGSRVEARFDGTYYPATVTSIDTAGNTYAVEFDDEDTDDAVPHADIRHTESAIEVIEGGEGASGDLLAYAVGNRDQINYKPEARAVVNRIQIKCLSTGTSINYWAMSSSGPSQKGYEGHLMVLSAGDYFLAADYAVMERLCNTVVTQAKKKYQAIKISPAQTQQLDGLATGDIFVLGGVGLAKLNHASLLNKIRQHLAIATLATTAPQKLVSYYDACIPTSPSSAVAYRSMVHHLQKYLLPAGFGVLMPTMEHTKVDMYLQWPQEAEWYAIQAKTFGDNGGYYQANRFRSPSATDFDIALLMHVVTSARGHPAAQGARLPRLTNDMLVIPMKRLIVEKVVKDVGWTGDRVPRRRYLSYQTLDGSTRRYSTGTFGVFNQCYRYFYADTIYVRCDRTMYNPLEKRASCEL